MLERFCLAGLLVAGLSLAGCQETPLAPTDVQERDPPVLISTAPQPLYAVPSSGVTFVANGEVQEYAYRASFDLVLRANLDNEIGVMLTSDNIVLQELTSVPVDGPGGGVDRETYRSDSHSGEDRIERGEETARAFDVWYTLPGGGREVLIAVSLDFVDDNGTPFSQVHQVGVEPLPGP